MNQYLDASAEHKAEQAPLDPHGFWGDRRIGRGRFIYLSAITILCAISLSEACTALAEFYQLRAPGNFELLWSLPGIWFGFIYLSHHCGRRLNDLNISRVWTSFLMIPLLNVVMFIYLAWHRGSSGTNEYGQPAAAGPNRLTMAGVLMAHIAILYLLVTP